MSDYALSYAEANQIEYWYVNDRQAWLERRQQDVTASVAAALLGGHPYQSAYGLHLLKAGMVEEDPEESAPMRRGRLLEPVAVQLLREQHPDWAIDRGLHYFRDPRRRIGATPDVFAVDPTRPGYGVVQIKNVEPSIFNRAWRDPDGEIEVPAWIAVQAIVEARLTGASWAAVAPLRVGHGVEIEAHDVPQDNDLWSRIWKRLESEVELFWQRVASATPPEPDFRRDGRLISHLYRDHTEEIIDLSQDNRILFLLEERERLKMAEGSGSAAAKDRKALDAELIMKLGKHVAGRLADGTLVTARSVNRKPYMVAASSYRRVHISALRNHHHPADEGEPF